jgi:hypothetical protein
MKGLPKISLPDKKSIFNIVTRTSKIHLIIISVIAITLLSTGISVLGLHATNKVEKEIAVAPIAKPITKATPTGAPTETIAPTPIPSYIYPTDTSSKYQSNYSCRSWGNGMRCDNGTTINENGRSENGGTTYRTIGNQIDGSDGSICEPSGGRQYTCSQR